VIKPDAKVWRAVRNDYCNKTLSIAAIARKHVVSYGSIMLRAARKSWVRPVGAPKSGYKRNITKTGTLDAVTNRVKLGPTPEVWAVVKHDYCKTGMSITDISNKNNVARSTIWTRAQRENWPRPDTASKAYVPPDDDLLDDVGSVDSARFQYTIVRRVYHVVNNALKVLELRSAQDARTVRGGGEISAANFERDTRAVATLIKNLGTLTEYESDLDAPRGGDGNTKKQQSSKDVRAAAGEADRCRRELAQRLDRIVKART
jgi:hypothetical protein